MLQNYVSTLRQKNEEETMIYNIGSDIPRLHLVQFDVDRPLWA